MDDIKLYDTCSRCKGTNDRPKQRECRTCHNSTMKQYRAEKVRAGRELNELLDRYEARIAFLVNENTALLARVMIAEAVVPRGISRETIAA